MTTQHGMSFATQLKESKRTTEKTLEDQTLLDFLARNSVNKVDSVANVNSIVTFDLKVQDSLILIPA